MQWGTELWDKYGDLCTHTSAGIDFLDTHVASFVKERGKIEVEYAKSLRALVKRYTPKESAASSSSTLTSAVTKPEKNAPAGSGPVSIMSLNAPEEEYTHLKAYKVVRMVFQIKYFYYCDYYNYVLLKTDSNTCWNAYLIYEIVQKKLITK